MLTSAAVMRLILLVAATLLAGCTALGPAAERLYPAHAASEDRMPVILIPGLLGSRLARARDGVEIWPGGTGKLLTSDYTDLALRIDPETLEPFDDGLVPSSIFEGAVGKDFYGRIMQELRDFTVRNNYFEASPSGYDLPKVGTNVFCGNTGKAPGSWKPLCK